MFGGTSLGVAGTATFEWDGTAWTPRDVSGPSFRSNLAMAYDSVRGVTVLFGGDATGGASAETWEWNGAGAGSWTRVAAGGPNSPPAMRSHEMVFDAARGVTVLFGGVNGSGQTLDQTWEWNGTSWTLHATAGPSPRTGHAMAYDSHRGVTILFGGMNGTGQSLGDTWEWNGTTWTQRFSEGPSPRYGHAMAYDSVRGVTMLFRGTNIYSADIWEWRGTSDGGSWTCRESTTPSARSGHAMAHDTARGVTVLFGGVATAGVVSAETWEWNGAVWTRRDVNGPSARSSHAMAYDAGRGVVVLFGGVGVSNIPSETWEWDGEVWTQRMVTGPQFRTGHSMTYDSARGVMVVFGGSSAGASQTWEWDGRGAGSWTQRQVVGPSSRTGAAMAYDASRGLTVLFGGQLSTSGLSGETWEWNGDGAGTWTQREVVGPSPRFAHAMVYDAELLECVVFGGVTSSTPHPSDSMTMSWDGSRWSGRTAGGPMRRAWHAMAYNPALGSTVLFGGNVSSSKSADTWHLRYYCAADLDNDGDFDGGLTPDNAVTVDDFLSFLTAFEESNLAADLDNGTGAGTPDGAVDINDLLFFLARFEAGC